MAMDSTQPHTPHAESIAGLRKSAAAAGGEDDDDGPDGEDGEGDAEGADREMDTTAQMKFERLAH